MKSNYKIENRPINRHHEAVLVSNYCSLNLIVNQPCIKNSTLLNMGYDDSNIGAWKIKQLKSK